MSLIANIQGPAALGFLLTGAASPLAAQTVQRSALGGYPSSTAVQSLAAHRPSALPGIWIDEISGNNGAGVGTLTVISATQMTWAAPGEAAGAPVTVAVNQPTCLYSATASKFVVVTRRASATFSGSEAVGLVEVFNNWLGGDNFDAAETAAGANKYLALMLYNRAESGAITNVKVWVDATLDAAVAVDGEAAVSSAIQSIANEDTAPSGRTFVSPSSSGTALTVTASLAAGAFHGLWRRRSVTAGASANAAKRARIYVQFTYGGQTYTREILGLNRIANADAEGYELYHALDAVPDDEGTPVETGGSSPLTWTTTLAEGRNRFAGVYRNQWGLASPVVPGINDGDIYIDGAGDEYDAPPNPPLQVTLKPTTGGKIQITVLYHPTGEALTLAGIRAKRATDWVFYVRGDGTDPDPSVDTPVVEPMRCQAPATDSEALVRSREITIIDTDAYTDGAPVRVLARTRRGTTESTNTAIHEATASATGPARPKGTAFLGRNFAVAGVQQAIPSGTYWIDQPNNIRIEYDGGSISFYGDATLVWRAIFGGKNQPRTGLYIPDGWTRINAAVSGAGTSDPVEVASWGATNVLYVNVNSVRRMKIDFDAMEITFLQRTSEDLTGYQYSDPILARFAETVFLIYDVSGERYESYLAMDADGTFRRGIRWDWGTKSQAAIEAL